MPVETLNRQFAGAWKNLADFNYTRSEWSNLLNKTFLGLTHTPLDENLFSELYREFGRAEAWRIFDDVLPALEFLNSRRLKLGIISNWDERLRPLLHELNLDRFFQTLVVSSEAGQCKPSPAIFKHAAKLLARPPDSILHIGDNLDLDVHGATSAGFQALLLARDTTKRPGQLSALVQLRELFS